MSDFCHLHNHTQFSLLDGQSSISGLMAKAEADGQKAVAITDHGNMFGAFKFVAEANKRGIKPILGCEFYVVEDRFQKSFSKGKKDKRFHQLLLAKNEIGYKNLSKLCSLGYLEGLYSKWPRVDRALIKQYSEGLIATSCCIGAEVPQAILHQGEEAAEKIFLEWLDIFGEDYFIELQRHNLKDIDGTGISQEDINQILIKWGEKYNVPIIATNDSHYIDEDDWNAHDILLCVNTGELQQTPIAKDLSNKTKGERFGFPNHEFYFKTQDEMKTLFNDVPNAIENTLMLAERVNTPKMTRDVLLPAFNMPAQFTSQAEYLNHLTYEGARKRYGELTPNITERLDFELKVIADSGYPGYFLIVQDFTAVARKLGVSVGPGRGSAAGSAVAYCLGITNVDPIKYDLLFERFLNPERVSLPDIDIDFDDEGREKVIDYVVDKYGKNQVAQIITYGSMAAKSSLRDVGRVMDIPLFEVDKVAKSFPDHLSASLNGVLADGGVSEKLKGKFNPNQLQQAEVFRKIAEGNDSIGKMIRTAKQLEGSIRNTGVHACGVIITPDDITNYIPVANSKDSELLLTQFDNSVVEDAGLLKMDFLGLKTLTIIKEAVSIIKQRHGIELDPEAVPLDDEKTYQLFQKGYTNGIFQFESGGMQKHLRDLKPDTFADLIAMNALYRPGPMEYIPDYVKRKHGKEPVVYDLPECEEYLKETYGITVYQEQVMLLSQKLAGFSKGQADMLRKGMGKKKKDVIDALFPKFIDGCTKNGLAKDKCEKIWKDWEAFASYAFNKSHSTCYAFIAYQTGYLKAHYPAEYMAAVLAHNMNDIKKVSFFMEECRRMKINVLGPDVNESNSKFTVNKKGEIRFALSAIKGVGGAAVDEIINQRTEEGAFTSLFDLTSKVNLRAVNKKSLESLAIAGAFDEIQGIYRSQYFQQDPSDGFTVLEKAIKYGGKVQESQNSSQASLFGDAVEVEIAEPKIPEGEPWPVIEMLNKEKAVTGIYLSGHPLDAYKLELESFNTTNTQKVAETQNVNVKFGGIVSATQTRFSKRGDKYCRFTIEDYDGSYEIMLFKTKYVEFGNYVEQVGNMIFISGINKPRYNSDEYMFEVTSIEMLSEMKDKYTKELVLELTTNDITEENVDLLSKSFAEHKGEFPVKFHLIDHEDKIELEFNSYKYRVDISLELLEVIESNFGKIYKLN